MPLPKPNPKETRADFMDRCMGDSVMVKEYPDSDQRTAVCVAQWRDRKGASLKRISAPGTFVPHSRGFTAVINTDEVDSDGEVLIPDGMDATSFRGAILWNHDSNRPIGKQVGDFRRYKDRVEAECEYAVRPATHPKDAEWFPDTVKALVEQGIVKGVSVGFMPLKGGFRQARREDVAKYGPECHTVHHRWRVIEWSPTPLNANPGAVIMAVRKSLLTRAAAASMFGADKALNRRRIYILL